MHITLTNAASGHNGERIIINTDFILTIYTKPVTRDESTIEYVTYVYCPPHGTWEVRETVEQIEELLAK